MADDEHAAARAAYASLERRASAASWSGVLLGVPWLGYGRTLEAHLTIVSAIYALVVVLSPSTITYSPGTIDFNPYAMAFAFFLKAVLTGSGLFCNVMDIRYSRPLRFSGAVVGSMIWGWFLAGFFQNGFGPLGTGVAVAGLIFSVRIAGMALADLPRPGRFGR